MSDQTPTGIQSKIFRIKYRESQKLVAKATGCLSVTNLSSFKILVKEIVAPAPPASQKDINPPYELRPSNSIEIGTNDGQIWEVYFADGFNGDPELPPPNPPGSPVPVPVEYQRWEAVGTYRFF